MYIVLFLLLVNGQIVTFFYTKWCQKDNELPPLLEYHKKWIIISAAIMFIVLGAGVSLGLLFQRQRLLFMVISVFLACLAVLVALHCTLQYVSLRKEIAERKLSRSKQA
jgi:lipopolysaccharide export LptBFGC system permease protein LptF